MEEIEENLEFAIRQMQEDREELDKYGKELQVFMDKLNRIYELTELSSSDIGISEKEYREKIREIIREEKV